MDPRFRGDDDTALFSLVQKKTAASRRPFCSPDRNYFFIPTGRI
jgi:hypothetical protein